ncbi:hypothetical protein BGZ63DRAFT_42265 [Mariannaea sp. PMI_226]|nr:hypothetical protein BGZ63DRAFT_42265 [Mariannaea sp. PMI_226]
MGNYNHYKRKRSNNRSRSRSRSPDRHRGTQTPIMMVMQPMTLDGKVNPEGQIRDLNLSASYPDGPQTNLISEATDIVGGWFVRTNASSGLDYIFDQIVAGTGAQEVGVIVFPIPKRRSNKRQQPVRPPDRPVRASDFLRTNLSQRPETQGQEEYKHTPNVFTRNESHVPAAAADTLASCKVEDVGGASLLTTLPPYPETRCQEEHQNASSVTARNDFFVPAAAPNPFPPCKVEGVGGVSSRTTLPPHPETLGQYRCKKAPSDLAQSNPFPPVHTRNPFAISNLGADIASVGSASLEPSDVPQWRSNRNKQTLRPFGKSTLGSDIFRRKRSLQFPEIQGQEEGRNAPSVVTQNNSMLPVPPPNPFARPSVGVNTAFASSASYQPSDGTTFGSLDTSGPKSQPRPHNVFKKEQ